MAIKGNDFGEDSQRKGENWRESFPLFREYVNHQQNVSIYMGGKGYSGEISDGNEEHVIGQWRKGDPCYKVAKELG